jgi:hypothetical protein
VIRPGRFFYGKDSADVRCGIIRSGHGFIDDYLCRCGSGWKGSKEKKDKETTEKRFFIPKLLQFEIPCLFLATIFIVSEEVVTIIDNIIKLSQFIVFKNNVWFPVGLILDIGTYHQELQDNIEQPAR